MSPEPGQPENKFVADRMLGPLTRYLRFMGYDTISANGFSQGNPREDTVLLNLALAEQRIILTRDQELVRRGKEHAVLVCSEDVMEQVQQLIDSGLIKRRLTLSRCSLCNSVLRMATADEIEATGYVPENRSGLLFCWCDSCKKLYWNGSHGKRLAERICGNIRDPPVYRK